MFPPGLTKRYRPTRTLGSGAMGAVYLAWDEELARKVAIKVALRPDHPGIVERFRREAKAMASIHHPHVAELLDFGEVGDQLFMVQEFLPGRPPVKGTLPDPVAAMLDVAEALEALHRGGVLHRDIKPANMIQREEDGAVVLIDFGLAQREGDAKLTETGAVLGTPYFLAPELMLGEPASPASDFYAWGVSLFRLLEGTYPVQMEQFVGWATVGERELTWSCTPEDHPGRILAEAAMAYLPEDRPTSRPALELLLGATAPPTPSPAVLTDTAPHPVPPGAVPGESSPPPRRGAFWGAAVAGVSLVGAFVYSLGPSGVLRAEAPRPAPPPASLLPEAEALDTVSRDLARHFRWETPGSERDPSWVRAATARAALKPLSDVRLPMKLGRAGEAAAAWVEAVGPDGWGVPGRAERFRVQVVGDILTVVALHRTSRNLQDHAAFEALQTGGLDPKDQMLEASIPELRDKATTVLTLLAETSGGEATLVFEAFVAGVTQQLIRPELPDLLVAALEAEPPSPLRASLGVALDFVTLHVISGGELSCDARQRVTDFRHRFFRASPEGFSLRERWRRRLRGMTFEIQLDRVCDPTNPKRRESQLGAYLDEIVARGSQVPDLVGTGLLDLDTAATRKHMLFSDASPWVMGVLPRVRQLRERFPAPPPEREPTG